VENSLKLNPDDIDTREETCQKALLEKKNQAKQKQKDERKIKKTDQKEQPNLSKAG